MHHNPEPFIPAQPASARASLPAVIDALPPDAAHPAQTQFTRARQAAFLQRLADCGEVRVAARAAGVSHQTVYRMRRSCRTFRRGWDAALIVARERAEDLLATRAIHGVEEQVFYHGEVIATRRRYDSRLLLAHLARLDRMAQREDVAELAEAFDDVIAAFEREGDLDLSSVPAEAGTSGNRAQPVEAPPSAGARAGAEITPSGPCNMRSMSRAEPGAELEGGDVDEDLAELPELERRLQAMEAARPGDALLPHQHYLDGFTPGDVEATQLAAFEAGEAEWWEAVPVPGEDAGSDADKDAKRAG